MANYYVLNGEHKMTKMGEGINGLRAAATAIWQSDTEASILRGDVAKQETTAIALRLARFPETLFITQEASSSERWTLRGFDPFHIRYDYDQAKAYYAYQPLNGQRETFEADIPGLMRALEHLIEHRGGAIYQRLESIEPSTRVVIVLLPSQRLLISTALSDATTALIEQVFDLCHRTPPDKTPVRG